jgi:hypothetical protein
VTLRTPEGEPIPANTLAELKRDMQRRRFICDQIRSIERERLERFLSTALTRPRASCGWSSHSTVAGGKKRRGIIF